MEAKFWTISKGNRCHAQTHRHSATYRKGTHGRFEFQGDGKPLVPETTANVIITGEVDVLRETDARCGSSCGFRINLGE